MKIRYLALLVLLGSNLRAQEKSDIITLGRCYEGAYRVSSIAGEGNTNSEIWQLKDRNLSKGWLPVIDANGTFIYNSSVVDMSAALGALPIPGITDLIRPLPHEQYKVTLDVNQLLYDGGAIKSARAVEKAELEINIKQTETDLYKLRSQINSYFFNILLLERQHELLTNFVNLLDKRLKTMQSAVDNGILLATDMDIIRAEKLKTGQQIAENRIRLASFKKILTELCGIKTDNPGRLVFPEIDINEATEFKRPELALFELRSDQLNASLGLLASKRLPKAFGFASLGYGNPPGNNFFKDEFAPYYILGAGVKWNIFDWNKARTEKNVITLQQSILENRKTDLEQNLERLLEVKRSEISSIEMLLSTDTELIEIRKKIAATAESQYENGIITATELLNEITLEKNALISFELHKVTLAMAKVEYLNISGQEID